MRIRLFRRLVDLMREVKDENAGSGGINFDLWSSRMRMARLFLSTCNGTGLSGNQRRGSIPVCRHSAKPRGLISFPDAAKYSSSSESGAESGIKDSKIGSPIFLSTRDLYNGLRIWSARIRSKTHILINHVD